MAANSQLGKIFAKGELCRQIAAASCELNWGCGILGCEGASALLVDPLGFDAGDSNLYRYVNNAPTDATDPSGEQELAGYQGSSDIKETARGTILAQNPNFPFPNGEKAKVIVRKDAAIQGNKKGSQEVKGHISIEITSPKTSNKDVEVLQFTYWRITYKKKGNLLSFPYEGNVSTSSGIVKLTTDPTEPVWHLDAERKSESIYYSGGLFDHTRSKDGKTLIVYDKPGIPLQDFQKIVRDPDVTDVRSQAIYVSYILVNGKIVGTPVFWSFTYIGTVERKGNTTNINQASISFAASMSAKEDGPNGGEWLEPSQQQRDAAIAAWKAMKKE